MAKKIHNHFVARYYLNGFCDTEHNIYRYERGQTKIVRTGVMAVAQEKGLYPNILEKYLETEVEKSGHQALKSIRARDVLTLEVKKSLADYMTIQYRRGPAAKVRFNSRIPIIRNSINTEDVDRQVDWGWIGMYGWHSTLNAKYTPLLLETLQLMTWQFLVYDTEPVFITSDNPICFDPTQGIARRDAELIFPIDSHVVLWLSWRTDTGPTEYRGIDLEGAKQFNKRIAHTATRYIFSAYNSGELVALIN